MATDWNSIKIEIDKLDEERRKFDKLTEEEKEERRTPIQKLNHEISGLKSRISSHCFGILPILEERAKRFNSDNEFVEFYKELRKEELKLEHLTKEEGGLIVKFAYPIRLYEESERIENPKKIITFRSGARLGIDTISGNGFVPALTWENANGPDTKYSPDDFFIMEFLYKKLNPEISEANFLKEVVKNLNYWDTNEKIEARERIFKRYEDNCARFFI